jgi:drug efflux transport system permease protein
MLARLRASIVKEFILFWRDPKTRSMLLGMPIVQMILFGFAANMEVKNVELVVINEDAGRWSAELIGRISSAQFTGGLTHLERMEELTARIEQRKALVAIHFPADFSRNVIDGKTASVQVIVDGRRANSGQVTLSYLKAIAGELGAQLAADGPDARPAIRAEVRNWFNPNLNYRWFIVPGLAGTMSMMVALMMTSLAIAREREMGTFDQLLVSPSTPIEILASKTLPALLGGGFVGIFIIMAGIIGFGVPFRGNLLLLVFALFPFLFSVVGIGLTVSSISNTQQQAALGLFFTIMPIMFTSGFVTPVENMPLWLQYVVQVNPLKHFLIIVQGSFLKSMPATDILANIWPLLLIGAVTFGTAAVLIRQRMD